MLDKQLKIEIIGLGYVGLPTFLMLKKSGLSVTGVDTNNLRLEQIKTKSFKLNDEELDSILDGIEYSTISNKNSYSDIYFIAVPTPINPKDNKPNLEYLFNAIDNLRGFISTNSIVVIESTVPPGTCEMLYGRLPRISHGNIVHCPERILPGNLYHEIIHNHRIIGADNKYVANKVLELYKTFVRGLITVVDTKTAELSKIIENSYRDVNIAFANEVLLIARDNGVDPYRLIELANLHPRVAILNPGPGVGGHCIPVDPWFLVGPNSSTTLIEAAREVNDGMPKIVTDRIINILSLYPKLIRIIGLYGMTYKADVEDFRESPSFKIYDLLKSKVSNEILTYDPFNRNDKQLNFNDFIIKSDLIVVLVDHKHIKLNFDILNEKIVFDTRNIIDLPNVMKL